MAVDTSVGLQLRCPLSDTKAIRIPSVTSTVAAGDMGVVNGLVGVYATSLAKSLSAFVAFIFNAPKIVLPCVAVPTGAFLQGDQVYYASATNNLSSVASGNTLVGTVAETAASGDTTVEVIFNAELGQ